MKIQFCFAVLTVVCLVYSAAIPDFVKGCPDKWYSRPVWFADWRNVGPVDFSTNVPVSMWYSGKHPGSYRANGWAGFYGIFFPTATDSIVFPPDWTVTVGIDYYALNISRPYVPERVIQNYGRYLADGEVLILRAYRSGILIQFEVK